MNIQKKENMIIVVLVITLIGVLTFGIIKDRKMKKDNVNDNEVSTLVDSTKEESKEETPAKEEKPVEEKNDLYGKLKNKSDIRMLVLGDGLALSQGKNTTAGAWDKGIANWITNTYGSNVNLVSLAKPGATSAVGVDVVSNNDISNYDLIVTCFGQNDNRNLVGINTFNTNYQAILDKIKEKNPNGIIIPLVPNTLVKDNAYKGAIEEIAQKNNLKVVDMGVEFNNSGVSINELLGNSGLPNDKGYGLYINAVTKLIENSMK